MHRSGRFERRLLIALVLFSVAPTLILVGVGTFVLGETVSLQTTPAGWDRLGESGRELLDLVEESGSPEARASAERHRAELTASMQQAQRWSYLNRRVLAVLPLLALIFFLALLILAVRWARRIARGLVRPIDELVGWSALVARGEPLPDTDHAHGDTSEFAVLRDSFRKMEAELTVSRERALESARMRASVSLARGVAHELKNALTPLRLAVRALQASPAPSAEMTEPLEVIDSESRRLEALARAFSQFGRPPEGPRSQIDLTELLQYLGRTHLPPTVTLVLDLPEVAVSVNGHYDALSRCFANLILNSVEAMGEAGGRLTVTVEPIADDRVAVRIADSGPGLPPGIEDRLWDPDFTTKARGTGLGLALVRQTIAAHGGSVHARPGKVGGAVFEVILPRTSDAHNSAPNPVPAAEARRDD